MDIIVPKFKLQKVAPAFVELRGLANNIYSFLLLKLAGAECNKTDFVGVVTDADKHFLLAHRSKHRHLINEFKN